MQTFLIAWNVPKDLTDGRGRQRSPNFVRMMDMSVFCSHETSIEITEHKEPSCVGGPEAGFTQILAKNLHYCPDPV